MSESAQERSEQTNATEPSETNAEHADMPDTDQVAVEEEPQAAVEEEPTSSAQQTESSPSAAAAEEQQELPTVAESSPESAASTTPTAEAEAAVAAGADLSGAVGPSGDDSKPPSDDTEPAGETMSADAESAPKPAETPAQDTSAPESAALQTDTAQADTAQADTSDADTSDADTPDADTPDADTPDADTPDADTPDVGTSEANTSEGEAASDEEGPLPPGLEPLVAAMEQKTRVRGKIIGWNKGGYHVTLDGVPAFCPKSQIEIGNPRRASDYIDKDYDFAVLEIKDRGKRIVVSRVVPLRENREAAVEKLRQARQSGEVISGKVSSITDFGAFVDVDGLDGLVHRSQITRARFEHPREVLSVGQEVQVKVLKIEKGGNRLSFSIKALEPDPWKGLEERLSAGAAFEGEILRGADFGLFVDVGDGVEGLIHESQLPLGKKLSDADLQPGNKIQGWVREVDSKRHRLGLSLREVPTDDPWQTIGDRLQEGMEVDGKVEQVAKFGIFVELEPGLTGLLPLGAAEVPRGTMVSRIYPVGQSLRVVVDSIDRSRKRISLVPPGRKLEGTKNDLRAYQTKQKTSDQGLNALAAAFAKIRE